MRASAIVLVMAALDPAIQERLARGTLPWIAGARPVMTQKGN